MKKGYKNEKRKGPPLSLLPLVFTANFLQNHEYWPWVLSFSSPERPFFLATWDVVGETEGLVTLGTRMGSCQIIQDAEKL